MMKKHFPELKNIVELGNGIGDIAIIQDGSWYVYNLITKFMPGINPPANT